MSTVWLIDRKHSFAVNISNIATKPAPVCPVTRSDEDMTGTKTSLVSQMIMLKNNTRPASQIFKKCQQNQHHCIHDHLHPVINFTADAHY